MPPYHCRNKTDLTVTAVKKDNKGKIQLNKLPYAAQL